MLQPPGRARHRTLGCVPTQFAVFDERYPCRMERFAGFETVGQVGEHRADQKSQRPARTALAHRHSH